VVAWLATRADWAAIGHALAGARLGPCLLALAIYAASQVVSSYRWQLLARPLGFTEPLGRFVTLYFVGMFFNLFLPTSVGGDVVRAWLLAGRSGRRWTAAVSVFSERFTGLLTLLLIACFASVGNLDALAPWALGTVWGATGAAFLGLALLPVLGRWH
jgi:uncharacterized protein (TIRG00374 family)